MGGANTAIDTSDMLRWAAEAADASIPTLVIDPGHGGFDPGAVYDLGPCGRIYEKDLALAIGRKLVCSLALSGENYRVHMTRSEDKHMLRWRRARFANRQKATLFVSVHVNSVKKHIDPETVRGVAVYHYPGSFRGHSLAQQVLDSLLETKLLPAFSDGVIEANYSVLRRTKMTAILIEVGFMKNTQDLNIVTNVQNQEILAGATRDGVKGYLL